MSERVSGRITNVWTDWVGTTLTQDEAAAATTLHVYDAAVFNDDGDGGWLIVGAEFSDGEYVTGSGQVIAYTDADDDAGTVTLAEALTAAADEDDSIHVWSDLYGEPDTRQWASVQPEGGDRADDIDASVDDGLELVDGDRGKRGEACTLFRESKSDVWTVAGVGGRPHRARGMKAEANDAYTLTGGTGGDIENGFATIPLTHSPVNESVKLILGSVPQEPTNYTVDYDAATITFPLDGWEPAGLRLSVHYWYLRGPVAEALVSLPDPEVIGIGFSSASSVSMALPGGWQEGDLVIAASRARTSISTTDPRLSNEASPHGLAKVWWGHLDGSGSPITLTQNDPLDWAAAVMMVLRGVTVAESQVASGTTSSTHSAPQFASAAAVAVVNLYYSGTVAPGTSDSDGSGDFDGPLVNQLDGKLLTTARLWTAPALQESPAGAFSHGGSPDEWACTALRLEAT